MDIFPEATSLLNIKKSPKFCFWWSEVCFFKRLCLLFFANVPGATFIQGATLIPESRVIWSYQSVLIWPQNFEKKKGLLIMNKNRSSKNCARVDFSVYVILSLFFCHVNFALVAGVRFSSTFFCHFYTHTQHIEIVLIWHPLLHFHYTIVGYATLCSI